MQFFLEGGRPFSLPIALLSFISTVIVLTLTVLPIA
jgi:hypothetical protein